MSIEVRKASPADAEAVARTEAECFSDPESLGTILSELNNPIYSIFVACDGDNVVGHIITFSVYNDVETISLAVTPSRRGEGIGGKLLDFIIKNGIEQGADSFFLEVRVSNSTAIGLYSSRGFEITGTRKNFYENPREDAYLMRYLTRDNTER